MENFALLNFDAPRILNKLVDWIRHLFKENGKDSPAVIGISGGKDSAVVAALSVRALGSERVIGVSMPNGNTGGMDMADLLVAHLGIQFYILPIEGANNQIISSLKNDLNIKVSGQTRINLPARLRMAALYAFSQSFNGRVSNNSNLSEDWIGYATRWGDMAGDFAPLAAFTASEVQALGFALGLPKELIGQAPADGLRGQSDEEHFGFTYAILDRYIRTGEIEDEAIRKKIDRLHRESRFKYDSIPSFPYKPENN